VGRLVRVLEALAGTPDGLGIRDTSRRTDIDKSVVSRLLTQLKALSMATREQAEALAGMGGDAAELTAYREISRSPTGELMAMSREHRWPPTGRTR
jgi:DNA-binding IclR family transcriptional regulator